MYMNMANITITIMKNMSIIMTMNADVDMTMITKSMSIIITIMTMNVAVDMIIMTCLLYTSTFPKERLRQIFASIKGAQTEDGATVVGINMEGPFLDPAKKGAHVEKWIAAPDVAFVRELNQDADGLVRLVTLAPNMDGAEEFIKEMHEEVCISLGHTAADYDCASRAMKFGAHHVTHLYNAMQPFGHRAPGLIGAAMDDPECMVELICDGYHIHPSAIRAAFRMFGPERVILISDSRCV